MISIRRGRLIPILGALILGALFLMSRLNEAEFQHAWRMHLFETVPIVRELIQRDGKAPDTWAELIEYWRLKRGDLDDPPLGTVGVGEGRVVDLADWVHYRKEPNGEVTIFFCREEIGPFDAHRRCSEDGRPRRGDVFLRLGRSAEIVSVS